MITHVFFDIDDTLFPSSEFAELARKQAIRAMIETGLPFMDSEKLYAKLIRIIKRHGSNYDRHFDVLCRELKVKNPARFIAAAVAAYHNAKTSILPYPEVPRTLLKLREEGYRLYVATNGSAVKQWDKLIRLGINLYFEEVFVSEEMGIEKSSKFFKKILGRLRIRPMQAVMIGDREKADVLSAKKAGMRTIRIQRQGKGKSRADRTIADFSRLATILKKL
ncbi:MAG TPA: TIGR02253 family HAD-type hydrolase [Candidatus Bilamarchaeaceae archaeon]|nr:TIGR02253 family HAD-type hydrolase [Candidatus Bilamarchaeaceae archaeon]